MAGLSPPEQLIRLVNGYWNTQMVFVAAKLGLADLVKAGPRPAADLAAATSTHPKALYRLLRALASLGIFAEDAQGRFGLTPLADLLRSDVPASQRGLAVMSGEEHYRAFGDLLYSINTGNIAFDHLYGMPCFEYYSRHPEQAKTFDEAMVGYHGRETLAMLDAYDFSGFNVLVDVGGGNGSLITAVLKKHPSLKGILYDLPGVIERARGNLQAAGLAQRCQASAGNFFEAVAPGGDAYLMRHIIHDWDDDKALRILQNIHGVIPAAGKLLLVEMIVPPGNDPSLAKLLDLVMLTIPGGQERTEAEYRALLDRAGFRLSQIVPTTTEIHIIEALKK